MLIGISILAACSDEAFPADRPDDTYVLQDMLLEAVDLPVPMEQTATNTFDNVGWAQLFDVEDFDAKRNQLDARRRIVGAVRIFSWDDPIQHLGGPTLITVHSTLYEDIPAAEDSMSLFCGMPIDESTAPEVAEFWVEGIGDQSQGLILAQPPTEIGRLLDTVVCFRTGRIVHAVVQNGLEGTQDVGLSLRMAQRMFERVSAAFDEL